MATQVQQSQTANLSSNSQFQSSAEPEWNRSLWRLAKTAELKKHTLNLKLQTAQILSAQDALEVRKSTLQDIKEQRNWLESERLSLLKQLELVISDRNKAIALEKHMQDECDGYSSRITSITEGEYFSTKQKVDAIRSELDLTPLRSLQSISDERASAYLDSRRKALQHRSAELAALYGEPAAPGCASSASSLSTPVTRALPSSSSVAGPSKRRGTKRRRSEIIYDDDQGGSDDDGAADADWEERCDYDNKSQAGKSVKGKGKAGLGDQDDGEKDANIQSSAPATDVSSMFREAIKRRGRPKGSKNKPKDKGATLLAGPAET